MLHQSMPKFMVQYKSTISEIIFNKIFPPTCCHLFVVGELRASVTQIAMLAGVFILLLGSPMSDR